MMEQIILGFLKPQFHESHMERVPGIKQGKNDSEFREKLDPGIVSAAVQPPISSSLGTGVKQLWKKLQYIEHVYTCN